MAGSVYGRKVWTDDAIDAAVQGVTGGITAGWNAVRNAAGAVKRGFSSTLGNTSTAGSGVQTYVDDPYSIASPAPATAPATKTMSAHVPGGLVAGVPDAISIPVPKSLAVTTGKTKTARPATRPASATPAAPAIAGVVTGSDAPQIPGVLVPGSPKLSRITEVGPGQINADYGPSGIAAYNLPTGGGIVSNGDETYVLRGRTAGEEEQNRTQQAQQVAAPSPLTSIAAVSPQQMTTYGDSTGVYQLASGQNPPPNYEGMTLAQVWAANRRQKDAVRDAGIANINSEIQHRGTQDLLAAAEQPSKINLNSASARHLNAISDIGIAKAPSEIAENQATTRFKNLTADIATAKLPAEVAHLGAETEAAKTKAKYLGEQINLNREKIKAMTSGKSSTTLPDYQTMAKTLLTQQKMYAELSATGGLSPEQKQDFANVNDALKALLPRMVKPVTQYNAGGTVAGAGGDEI